MLGPASVRVIVAHITIPGTRKHLPQQLELTSPVHRNQFQLGEPVATSFDKPNVFEYMNNLVGISQSGISLAEIK